MSLRMVPDAAETIDDAGRDRLLHIVCLFEPGEDVAHAGFVPLS